MNATTDPTAIARLEGVSKTYGSGPTAVRALRHVDLELSPGELVVLLGPSGSGKTTLLNLIGGIETPTEGRVVVAGRDLTGLDADALTEVRRETVGFVFQFFNLIPTLTAHENVGLTAELTGGAVDGRVEQVLGEVGLADRADHFPGQLSGGEQQRVAIARALVKSPPLLLCDEPTGALDIETGRTILTLLQRLRREHGQSILVVTHNAAVGGMADRVITMRSGELVGEERHAEPVDAAEVSW